LNYHWPGNIRELISVLKRAGIELEGPITGKQIRSVIYGEQQNDMDIEPVSIVNKIFKELKAGKSFWKVVKEPFLNRDLKREEVKAILAKALKESGGTYKNLIKLFGIKEEEYKNFMRFLYDNDLK
jgi:transcriptional regulator with AAA-type ATPase domain